MGTKGLIICYLALLCFTSICVFVESEDGEDDNPKPEPEEPKECTKDYCGIKQNVECVIENDKEFCRCNSNIERFNRERMLCMPCDCGENSECSFVDDQKVCNCKEGFADKSGTCTSCVKECEVNKVCSFNDEEVETCKCKNGFAQQEDLCTECTCDDVNEVCSLTDEGQTCKCKEGFDKKGDVCTKKCDEDNTCGNGGECKDTFCICKEGTSGALCSIINDCKGDKDFCGSGDDVTCSYDPSAEKPYCECDLLKQFDYNVKKCKIKCDDTVHQCQNGGECNDAVESPFCKCKTGTSDDLCSVIDDCKADSDFCGSETEKLCRYDSTKEKAYCDCGDESKEFDPKAKECRTCECEENKICSFDDDGVKICNCKEGFGQKDGTNCIKKCDDADNKCVNGGNCNEHPNGPFCECKTGTSGDLCSVIEACKDENLCGTGDDVTCSYDAVNEEPYCKCGDTLKLFDVSAERCKIKCDDTVHQCQNGGECNGDVESPFCKCKTGTSDDLCSVIDDCKADSDFCGSETEKLCRYDSTKEKAYCDCGDASKQFDPKAKECRICTCEENEICSFDENGNKVCDCSEGFGRKEGVCTRKCDETEYKCNHGGNCTKQAEDDLSFCHCKTGTSGDLCSIVDVCESSKTFCGPGEDAECDYDENKEEAYCRCKSEMQKFDTALRKCRQICTGDNSCCNEGHCVADVEGSENKFCSCVEGTSGDFCTVVDDCINGVLHCGEAEDIRCVWDSKAKIAKCECKDGLYYESGTQTCINCTTCGEGSYGCKITGADDAETSVTCFCNEGFIQHEEECTECDCGKNGTCFFNETNAKICDCQPGFLVNNEKCEECQCGTHGKCSFIDGKKHCDCEKKYGFNETECIDCKCGEASGCTFKAGKKLCDCLPNFAQKGELCEECKCGKNFICSFVDGKPNCTCKPKFGLNNTECVACNCHESFVGCTITGDKILCLCAEGYALKDSVCTECDCKHGKCSFEKGQKQCDCDKGYAFKGDTCQVCDCGQHGKCSFDGTGNKKCECDDGFAIKNETCHATCQQGTCKNGGTCSEGKDDNFCTCLKGTVGAHCEIIVDCLDSLKECKGDNGKCTYDVNKQKAQCYCPTGKEFDDASKKCKITCSEKSCLNQGVCKEKFCICNEGTSGDLCDIVDGCSKLKETCQKAKAECKYAPDKPGNAACFCIESGYSFEEGKNECKPIWCKENACSKDSECKVENGVGYCECKNPEQYFNYEKDICQEYDPCLFKTCKENQICDKGTCKCMPLYKEVGDKCVPNFCSKNPCFDGAKCAETFRRGVVKCLCNEEKFYDGSKCIDGSCFLPNYRQNCTEKCPPNFERDENGICVYKNESYRCNKECQYGTCVLKNDKETCVCIPKYAKLQDGVCVLNAAVVCASKLLTDDFTKCNATDQYKYAENGITLEKKSCADLEVINECRAAAATCKDNWNKNPVYECACEAGYRKNSNGYCAEPCHAEKKSECMQTGKSCFITEMKQAKCDCPPPLSWNEEAGKCNKIDKETFLLQNLPVLKKKYIRGDGSIDKVSLNSDFVLSMKQFFKYINHTYLFDYVQPDNTDVLNCSVIVKFIKEGKSEVKRLKALRLPEINCTDCDVENLFVLPPSLILHTKSLDEVTDEQADLCSKPLTKSLCGEYAECNDDKCFCPEGFKVIDYSVQKNKQFTILRCEDVDECAEKKHVCHESTNSTCQNTIGGYYCKCLPGFKKIDTKLPYDTQENKDPCNDLCTPDPCNKGTCVVKDKTFDCNCQLGYSGSLCNREDSSLKKANTNIKIVGAVLGTLLGITLLLFIAYVWRKKAYKYSEDFSISPQYAGDTEMRDGRPMRGLTNRAYE